MIEVRSSLYFAIASKYFFQSHRHEFVLLPIERQNHDLQSDEMRIHLQQPVAVEQVVVHDIEGSSQLFSRLSLLVVE